MAKFAVAVIFKVQDGKQDEVAKLFRQLSERANAFPGCDLYAVHYMGSPGEFLVYQLFADEESFHAFREPEDCLKLRRAVDAMCISRERMHIVGAPL